MSKASGGQSAWRNWCALAERIVADAERHHGRRSLDAIDRFDPEG